jgi:hypothetical protein
LADTKAQSAGSASKPQPLESDQDLSHLIPAVIDEPIAEDDPLSESPPPDEAIGDLLDLIESETNADGTTTSPVEPATEARGGKPEPPSSPEGGQGAAAASESPVDQSSTGAEPVPEDAITVDDLSALVQGGPGDADDTSCASVESVTEPETDPADHAAPPTLETVGPTESDSSRTGSSKRQAVAAVSSQAAHYLKAALLLADDLLERADDTLDSLHPRARQGVGVAGLVMLGLALLLLVTQLLGWI